MDVTVACRIVSFQTPSVFFQISVNRPRMVLPALGALRFGLSSPRDSLHMDPRFIRVVANATGGAIDHFDLKRPVPLDT
jgi:hypothetical protein